MFGFIVNTISSWKSLYRCDYVHKNECRQSIIFECVNHAKWMFCSVLFSGKNETLSEFLIIAFTFVGHSKVMACGNIFQWVHTVFFIESTTRSEGYRSRHREIRWNELADLVLRHSGHTHVHGRLADCAGNRDTSCSRQRQRPNQWRDHKNWFLGQTRAARPISSRSGRPADDLSVYWSHENARRTRLA